MKSPRLRIFAGPNGSGKSTIKEIVASINPGWLGVYVNPDEIENMIRENPVFDFRNFGVQASKVEITNFLSRSSQLTENNLLSYVSKLNVIDDRLSFEGIELNSYYVSALADLLHSKLIEAHTSFSFESVMSHPSKIELLKRASNAGFRNYLYFIATEDPEINISRVKIRVNEGGHDVPPDRIISRYFKTLNNLIAAIRATNRAFIYDNSGAKATLIAEITEGHNVEIKNSNVPVWFQKYVIEKARSS